MSRFRYIGKTLLSEKPLSLSHRSFGTPPPQLLRGSLSAHHVRLNNPPTLAETQSEAEICEMLIHKQEGPIFQIYGHF